MRLAVLLTALLVVACSGAQTAAQSTNAMSCKLPVSIADASGHLQGAFVAFPGGKMTVDHAGDGGAYYDGARSRWLPASRSTVLPEGTRYAYLDRKVPGTPGLSRLHTVEVSTGKDTAVDFGQPGDAYVIVEFAPEGVWLTYSGYEAPGRGLFLLDLATGRLQDHAVLDLNEPVAGAPGVFWFTDPGPNPQIAAIGFPIPARVLRLTTADGKAELWAAKPGKYVRVFGADLAGHPIFGTYSDKANGYDISIAKAPNDDKLIGLPVGVYGQFADSHGVWFGGAKGIYLYSTGGELRKISDLNGSPAGSCV